MVNRIMLRVIDASKYAYYSDFLRAIIFGLEVFAPGEAEDLPEVVIDYSENGNGSLSVAVMAIGFHVEKIASRMTFTSGDFLIYDVLSRESAITKAVKLALISVLAEAYGRTFSWGTLTGVRPTKVVHKLLDRGYCLDEITDILQRLYRVDSIKAKIITDLSAIATRHKPTEIKSAALYVAIPYCPSKCNYCSFPSYVLKDGVIEKYLDALCREIELVSQFTRSFLIDSIYIGGGTPAVLQPQQVVMLFEKLRCFFHLSNDCEITFEAGRSELINGELLAACHDSGVGRISVNPQTIHEKTLVKISRPGGRYETDKAVELVRTSKIPILNMDLIAGLPGESVQDYRESLEYLLEKQPENITVHALALKRASKFVSEHMQLDCPGEDDVAKMFAITTQKLADAGYMPYYMYRQKHMPGDQENMGYCLNGFESIYNINMIEDWQTIIGLGAGAATKILSSDGLFRRSYNPKDPIMYMNELMQRMDARHQLFDPDYERR